MTIFPALKLLSIDIGLLIPRIYFAAIDTEAQDLDGTHERYRSWRKASARLLDVLHRSIEEVDLAITLYRKPCEYVVPNLFDGFSAAARAKCPDLGCARVSGIPTTEADLLDQLRAWCAETDVEFTSWDDENFGRGYNKEIEGLADTWWKNAK